MNEWSKGHTPLYSTYLVVAIVDFSFPLVNVVFREEQESLDHFGGGQSGVLQ